MGRVVNHKENFTTNKIHHYTKDAGTIQYARLYVCTVGQQCSIIGGAGLVTKSMFDSILGQCHCTLVQYTYPAV